LHEGFVSKYESDTTWNAVNAYYQRTIVTDITTFPKKLPELCGIIAVAGKNYVTITQGHAFYFYHCIQKAEVCTC